VLCCAAGTWLQHAQQAATPLVSTSTRAPAQAIVAFVLAYISFKAVATLIEQQQRKQCNKCCASKAAEGSRTRE